MAELVDKVQPEAVFICVGENDLHNILSDVPSAWKNRLVLIQNELLPRDWLAHAIDNPTVISVWFEKKKGIDSKVVIPSPIYGAHARLVFNALAQLDLPSYIVDNAAELEYELVRKNLYIVTTNIAGLEVGGDVAELETKHKDLMNAVAKDVLDIQDWLTNKTHDRARLMQGLKEAFAGDPQHKCMGRSAPARLQRALGFASEAGIEAPTLHKIAAKHLS